MSRGVLRLLVLGEVRRSWRALLGLALLVAVVGTVVLAAGAGARRTATVVERAQEITEAADMRLQVDTDQEVIDRVGDALESSDAVSELARVRTLVVAAAGGERDLSLYGDLDGSFGRALDRPIEMTGRLPALDAPDEVALNEVAASDLDLRLGDTLPVGTFTPDDLEAMLNDDGFPGFNGPELELRVVGVVRLLDDLQGGESFSGPRGLVGPAFFSEHPDVGVYPEIFDLRLRDPASGAAEVEAIARDIAPDVEVSVMQSAQAYIDSIDRAINVLTVGLVVFTAVAAAAGLIVVGQAAARQVQSTRVDEDLLQTLGMTRSRRVLAIGAPAVLATVIGSFGAVLGAALASPLFPVGFARTAEADRGIRIDVPVLVGGALVLAAVTAAFVVLWSRRRTRVAEAERRTRLLAALSAPFGRPVPLIGTRLALDPGRGRQAVPVRSAVIGAAIGVLGIVGVGVVVTSLDTLVEEPDRWGWTWSSAPDVEDPDALAGLDADERLEAVASLAQARVFFDGHEATGFSIDQRRGTTTLPVSEGRAPAAEDEVALGQRTAAALDADVGDTVEVVDADGETVTSTVTGIAILPLKDNASPGEGAYLTPEGLERVRSSDGFKSLLLTYPAGVDAESLEAALAEDYGLAFSAYSRPEVPGDVSNIQRVRSLTSALGAFFAVLAVLGLVHLLAVSARRRRLDIAVLRALGFRRRQVRRTVAVQAVVITGLGLVIGVPIGLVAGRATWRLMVGDIGVLDAPSQPWTVLAVIIPAVLLLAVLVAAVPAWGSTRRVPATALRAE